MSPPEERVVRSGGPSATTTSNYPFAVSVADTVRKLAPSFMRGKMTVYGFTPVCPPPDSRGMFIVEIEKDTLSQLKKRPNRRIEMIEIAHWKLLNPFFDSRHAAGWAHRRQVVVYADIRRR